MRCTSFSIQHDELARARIVGCVLTAGHVQIPHVVSPAQRANPADALAKLAACQIYTVSELGTEPSTRSKRKRESAVHCLALRLIMDLCQSFATSFSPSLSFTLTLSLSI